MSDNVNKTTGTETKCGRAGVGLDCWVVPKTYTPPVSPDTGGEEKKPAPELLQEILKGEGYRRFR